MGTLTSLKTIKTKAYKVLYQRIFFTLMVIVIYIFGSHLTLPGVKARAHRPNNFLDLALSNVGGDLHSLNVFSLGLGPWLTTMIVMTLLSYRNIEKEKLQTRLERHVKERFFTTLLAIIQGYFLISQYVKQVHLRDSDFVLLMLILVTGTLFLVWLADQNTVYGIAGPTPIVLVSIIKSIFQNQHLQRLDVMTLGIGIGLMLVVLISLVWLERIEYRLIYRDMMNVTTSKKDTYISWKLNPAGSITVMFNFSLFFIVGICAHLIGKFVLGHQHPQLKFLEIDTVIGVIVFLVMLIVLNFVLSQVILNSKRQAKNFQKSGHYFEDIYPGKETERYLKHQALKVSTVGAGMLGWVISLPLLTTMMIPDMVQQLSTFTQFVILIYMTINITETVRTYLYFDQYQSFLDPYRKE
ncbi:accessory Sec system protein translocase subunit SecY2 [Staphylococcus delphini]|uniref:accessory Sec system protein translocase subunit SecY2 n=1 Tax=Staphylococcus delphini TaxID=53344 RepID=UPI003364C07B